MKSIVDIALNILDIPSKRKQILSESPKKKSINDHLFDLIEDLDPDLVTKKHDKIIDVIHELHDTIDELSVAYKNGKLSGKELAKAVFSTEPKLHE